MQQLTLFDIPSTLPIEYYPGFLHSSEADVLMNHCKALAWQQNEIRMLGKPLQVPRLECMYGKDGASYLYSGSVTLDAHPWTPELLYTCDRITIKTGFEFDIAIGNRYRTGLDSIGWHSDDEPSMGYRPAIASISLGACRKFSIKSRVKGSKSTNFWLEHGSLLLMLPGVRRAMFISCPKMITLGSTYPEIYTAIKQLSDEGKMVHGWKNSTLTYYSCLRGSPKKRLPCQKNMRKETDKSP